MMNFFSRRALHKRLVRFAVAFGLFSIFLLYSTRSSAARTPKLDRWRLKPANGSTRFEYIRFRDLSSLTTRCESLSAIDCLAYLHRNQSEYLQAMSTDEVTKFNETYCSTTNRILFHTFWNDASRLDHDFLRLHIDSFLYTQNRRCSRLIVWLTPPVDLEVQRRANRFYEGDVEFRSLLDLDDELRQVGMYVQGSIGTFVRRWFSDQRAQIGDAARFIVLHKFGGVYVDVDTLFLRDLQPLFAHEFAYKWSYVDGFNTAVLRLFPQSNVSALIIERGKQSQTADAFYPLVLHRYGLPTSFHRLPCAFFDSIWFPIDRQDPQTQREWKVEPNGSDGFKDPFRTTSEISRRGRHVFDGAFTFHWHSSSGLATFQPNSYFHQWRTFLDTQLYEPSDGRTKRKTLNSIVR